MSEPITDAEDVHVPPTEAELEELERIVNGYRETPWLESLRLIAEVRRLRAVVDELGFQAGLEAARANQAEAERDEARAEVERLRARLAGILGEFEGLITEADRPKGGMQVPYHGDFAPVLQLPSVVNRIRWWVRHMKEDQ